MPKDPATGVEYAVNDEYTDATHFPGAVLIPSHKGKFGAQHGVNLLKPLSVTVDPDYDDSFVMDADAIVATRNSMTPGDRRDPVAAYKRVATEEECMPASKSSSAGVKPAKKQSRKPKSAAKVTPAASSLPPAASDAPVAASAPSPGVDTAPDTVETRLEELRALVHSLTARWPDPSLEPAAARDTTEQAADAADAASDAGVPGSGVPAPELEVEFSHDQLGTVTGRYHKATVQGGLLILVYDSRWKYGTRYVPPADPERVFDVVIRPSDGGEPASLRAVYVGISFQLESQIIMVLIVPSQEPSE